LPALHFQFSRVGIVLEPVRSSAGELARRCGAGDFACRGGMFPFACAAVCAVYALSKGVGQKHRPLHTPESAHVTTWPRAEQLERSARRAARRHETRQALRSEHRRGGRRAVASPTAPWSGAHPTPRLRAAPAINTPTARARRAQIHVRRPRARRVTSTHATLGLHHSDSPAAVCAESRWPPQGTHKGTPSTVATRMHKH